MDTSLKYLGEKKEKKEPICEFVFCFCKSADEDSVMWSKALEQASEKRLFCFQAGLHFFNF